MKKAKETHTRKIINQFIYAQAINEEHAISKEEIKVEFSDDEKQFLINSLLSSEYLIKTTDKKMWFNQNEWNKSIKKMTLQYSLIMSIPIAIAVILYVIVF